MITEPSNEKLNELRAYIKRLDSVGVAFSAGVDSTLLLKVAYEVLGDKCVAITAQSPGIPFRERDEAVLFCQKEGIRHIVFESEEFHDSTYLSNPPDRCYHCKKIILSQMLDIVKKEGLQALIEGSNADDTNMYRPGERAVRELGVLSPLKECGLTKKEIRTLSLEMGLGTYDKPSSPCLATRIPYGERITPEKTEMIGKAEDLLLELGFSGVRVRINEAQAPVIQTDVSPQGAESAGSVGCSARVTESAGNTPGSSTEDVEHNTLQVSGNSAQKIYTARIEVPVSDISRLIEDGNRERIVAEFKKLGFTYVTMDLSGYRSGSMDEVHLKSSGE